MTDKKIKCIDNFAAPELEQGKTYSTSMEYSGYYAVEMDNGDLILWRKDRFVEIVAITPIIGIGGEETITPQIIKVISSYDDGYCACGIAKEMCDYHRD